MNKLYTFIAILIFTFFVLISKEKTVAINTYQSVNTENTLNPESGSSIQAPVIPPFYLISKEDAGVQTILEFGRSQFVFIQPNRLVPTNFCFKKDLIPTSVLIDYKMPVPLYIHGHALRH